MLGETKIPARRLATLPLVLLGVGRQRGLLFPPRIGPTAPSGGDDGNGKSGEHEEHQARAKHKGSPTSGYGVETSDFSSAAGCSQAAPGYFDGSFGPCSPNQR